MDTPPNEARYSPARLRSRARSRRRAVACRLPFVAAAGLAGSSAWFAAVRPYLLGASVLLIGFAFFQAHRAKQCICRPSPLRTAVLWVSAAMIAVMIFFPQVVAADSSREDMGLTRILVFAFDAATGTLTPTG